MAGESNDGVRLIGGGSVTNSGAISGSGQPFADGISMFAYDGQPADGYGALVTNNDGATLVGARYGVILSGGGDVANAGAIEAGAGMSEERRVGDVCVGTRRSRLSLDRLDKKNDRGEGAR